MRVIKCWTAASDLPAEQPHSIEGMQTAITLHAGDDEMKRKQKNRDKTGGREQSGFGEAIRAFHR
jgi:hypothetical protein